VHRHEEDEVSWFDCSDNAALENYACDRTELDNERRHHSVSFVMKRTPLFLEFPVNKYLLERHWHEHKMSLGLSVDSSGREVRTVQKAVFNTIADRKEFVRRVNRPLPSSISMLTQVNNVIVIGLLVLIYLPFCVLVLDIPVAMDSRLCLS
jgi:hypothetical protein